MSFCLIKAGSYGYVPLNIFREEPFGEEYEAEISAGKK